MDLPESEIEYIKTVLEKSGDLLCTIGFLIGKKRNSDISLEKVLIPNQMRSKSGMSSRIYDYNLTNIKKEDVLGMAIYTGFVKPHKDSLVIKSKESLHSKGYGDLVLLVSSNGEYQIC